MRSMIGSTRRPHSRLVFCAMLVVASATGLAADTQAQDFNRDVRPILSDRCFKCHGPDQAANESGLRLDIESEAHDSEAFVPGDPEASSAMERILTEDDDLKMPPTDSHLTLSSDEIETLRQWVVQGARYDQHWSFKPLPAHVAIPDAGESGAVQNGIDAFVHDQLRRRQLTASPDGGKVAMVAPSQF